MLNTYKNNSFDAFRLIAALAVVFSHNFSFYHTDDYFDKLTGIATSKIGLIVFFVLSGFLVTRSFQQRRSIKQYITNRLLRILPALIAAILLSMFVIGPLITPLSLANYFKSPVLYQYLAVLLLFRTQLPLPAIPHINVSLWTICLEIRLYLWLILMYFIGAYRYKILFVVAFLLFFILQINIDYRINLIYLKPELVNFITNYTEYGLIFMLGSLFYLYPVLLNFQRKKGIVIGILFLIVSLIYPFLRPILYSLVLPYLTLQLGLKHYKSMACLTQYGDFSYGIYVYAYPIQCLVFHYTGVACHPMIFFALTLILILPTAIFSWFFIEKPVLAKFKT